MGATEIMETMIIIRAVDAFTAPARRMAAQMGLVGAQAEALQQKLAGFKNMAFVGGALTLVGAGIAKGLLDAANAAGELQMSLTGVRTALKLNNDEYQKAMNLSQTIGIPTGFTAQEVGSIMQAMATSGLNKQQVMDPNILKEYVNFADIQSALKHENGPDVVASAVKMAHQYQLYSTEQLDPFLNQLNAALTHTHQTASEFQTSYRYIAPVAKTMGMSAQDTLTTTAWLDRMGMGSGRGGGGTAEADFLRRSIYHSSGKQADEAMVAAGFVKNGRSIFQDAKGVFVGMPEAIKIMQDFGTKFHGDSTQMLPLLNKIFGTVGAKVAIGMSSGGAAEQYLNVQEQITGSTPISAAQKALNEQWARQKLQLGTEFNDIWTNFGQGAAASLLPFLTGLNDMLAKIVLWTQANPEIMKYIATFTSIAAAALLIVGPLLLITGVLGYLHTAGMFSASFKLLGAAIKGASGPMLILIAAGYLLYEAWKNDWGGIREKTKAVTDWIAQEIPKAAKNVKDFAKDLGLIDDQGKLSDVVVWLGKIATAVYVGVKAYEAMKLAAFAFNLMSAANPWLLPLALIAAAVVLIITHWDEVKAAIDGAIKSVREFLGITSGGKTKEQQGEDAWTKFNNGTLPAPNPNATLQPTPHNPWANPMSGLQKWVRGYAAGTNFSSAGLAWVGEHGPELLNLPGGSQITPNHRLSDMVPQKGGSITFTKGAIVVNAAPGQSPDEIADTVMRRFGTKTRTLNLSRSMGANRLVFG